MCKVGLVRNDGQVVVTADLDPGDPRAPHKLVGAINGPINLDEDSFFTVVGEPGIVKEMYQQKSLIAQLMGIEQSKILGFQLKSL